jgi:hypothetical protein
VENREISEGEDTHFIAPEFIAGPVDPTTGRK